MVIPAILTAILVCVLAIQIFLLANTYRLVRQSNHILYDLKFLLAKYRSVKTKPVGNSKICKNCTFRMTYIHISDAGTEDAFYYKCRLHAREITLKDSCPDFNRYTPDKRS
jgi:hypothetical protein